jgi:hypothetical protein
VLERWFKVCACSSESVGGWRAVDTVTIGGGLGERESGSQMFVSVKGSSGRMDDYFHGRIN